VRIDVKATVLTALIGGPSVIAALICAAPAMADPVPVVPMPPVPAPADPAVVTPSPPQDASIQAASADPATPPEGVPHLPSPENLPPGTTNTPPDAGQPRTMGYLRDLWHAVQTQEVSGKDALLLLTQLPLDPNAAPPPGMAANPTPPLPPGPPLLPEPPPAP
jgi:hypothetical protein